MYLKLQYADLLLMCTIIISGFQVLIRISLWIWWCWISWYNWWRFRIIDEPECINALDKKIFTHRF